MTHPTNPADDNGLTEAIRAALDDFTLNSLRIVHAAEQYNDTREAHHDAHLEEVRTQTAALERMAEAVTDATESVNAREFARIADRSEARLSGYAGAGMLALLVALLAASQLRIPIWDHPIPAWMATPAAWTAGAYSAVAVLIAITRLADTRFLLVTRINTAINRRRAPAAPGPAGGVADPR